MPVLVIQAQKERVFMYPAPLLLYGACSVPDPVCLIRTHTYTVGTTLCKARCTIFKNMAHRNNVYPYVIQWLVHVLSARFGYIRAAKLPNEQNDEVIATQRSRHEVMSLVSGEFYAAPDIFFLPGTLYYDEPKI